MTLDSKDFAWKEVQPGRWERDIDEVEQFYTSLAKSYEGSGRVFFAMTGFVSFSITVNPERALDMEHQAEEALRRAWLRLRHEHPTIGAWVEYNFEQNKCKKVYETFSNRAAQLLWLENTFRVVFESSSGLEWCNSDPPVPKLPTLFLIKSPDSGTGNVNADLVLRCHHDIVDGVGTLLLFNNLFSYAAEAFDQKLEYTLPSFGDEWTRLSPPLRVAAGIPSSLDSGQKRRLDEIVSHNAFLRTGVEIASVPFKHGETKPGKHQRVALTLLKEQTTNLLAACKSLGLSVTHAYHAAIAIVMRDLQERTSDERTVRYISYSLINERPHCVNPYSTPEHAVSVYHSVSGGALAIDLTVPAASSPSLQGLPYGKEQQKKDYMAIGEQIREFYVQIRNDNEHITMVPSYWAMSTMPYPAGDKTPPVPDPNETPSMSISSMGTLDRVIKPTHGPFELDSPWVTGEELGTGFGFFLGTWNGQLTLSAAYNDGWHDREEALEILEKCNQVTLASLIG